MDKSIKKKRRLIGVVTSDKMQKTVVVKVTSFKTHKKYQKSFQVYKKYKAHDEKNEYHVGDEVIMEETRPLSADKRFRVVGKINK